MLFWIQACAFGTWFHEHGRSILRQDYNFANIIWEFEAWSWWASCTRCQYPMQWLPLFIPLNSHSKMALNWTMLTPNRTPVPLPNETTITMVDLGAEVDLLIPDQPPSNHALAGGFGGAKKLKSIGKIWLTDQRVRADQLNSSAWNSYITKFTVHLRWRFKKSIRFPIRSTSLHSFNKIRAADFQRQLSSFRDQTVTRWWFDWWNQSWGPFQRPAYVWVCQSTGEGTRKVDLHA